MTRATSSMAITPEGPAHALRSFEFYLGLILLNAACRLLVSLRSRKEKIIVSLHSSLLFCGGAEHESGNLVIANALDIVCIARLYGRPDLRRYDDVSLPRTCICNIEE